MTLRVTLLPKYSCKSEILGRLHSADFQSMMTAPHSETGTIPLLLCVLRLNTKHLPESSMVLFQSFKTTQFAPLLAGYCPC